MTRLRRAATALGVALVLVVLAAFSAAADNPTVPVPGLRPGFGIIAGTVTGPPDSRFVVEVERVGHPGSGAQTNVRGDGTYAIGAEVGDYRVTFMSDAWGAWEFYPGTRATSKAAIVHVTSQRATLGVDATLEGGGYLTGQVNYPPGPSHCCIKESVTAYYLDGSTWRPVPQADSGSAEPRFVLNGLPTGTYRLRYNSNLGAYGLASGFLGGSDDAAASTPVKVVAGTVTTVDITPRPAGTLSGRIVDSRGRPVAGAVVGAGAARYGLGELRWDDWSSDTTDASGRYTLRDLDTGSYYLEIDPPEPFQFTASGGALKDYRRYVGLPGPQTGARFIPVKAAQANTTDDEVVLRAGTVEGTIRDRSGEPVEGIEVTARRGYGYVNNAQASSDDTPLRTTTDENGHYSFGPLTYAPYEMGLRDPDGVYYDDQFPIVDDEDDLPLYAYSGWTYAIPEKATVVDATIGSVSGPIVKPSDPSPGQTLQASLPDDLRDVPADDPGWQWLRDKEPVPGATSSTYRVTAADIGHRLNVSVEGERRGRPITHYGGTSYVRVRPVVSLLARSLGHGRVRLTIAASAPGVAARLVVARVDVGRVRRGPDHLVTRSLRDGRLVVTLSRQPKGRHRYTVQMVSTKDRFRQSSKASAVTRIR